MLNLIFEPSPVSRCRHAAPAGASAARWDQWAGNEGHDPHTTLKEGMLSATEWLVGAVVERPAILREAGGPGRDANIRQEHVREGGKGRGRGRGRGIWRWREREREGG